MLAMPLWASVEATAKGAPCLLSVNPWPKIATGQPLVGRGPEGMKRLKKISSVPWAGTDCRVGAWGMNTPAFCQCCPENFPNAILLMEPGNTCNAPSSAFKLFGMRGPTVNACTFQVSPVTVFN